MKKLSIEEKAKAYDEAIKKGKQILNTPYTAHWDIMKEIVEHLLPKLKESEDERIRKCVKYAIDKLFLKEKIVCDVRKDDVLTWLEKQGNINPTEDELEALRMAAYEPTKNWSEKLQSLYMKLFHCEQGEQKPADKVEPKFKVGDWITIKE